MSILTGQSKKLINQLFCFEVMSSKQFIIYVLLLCVVSLTFRSMMCLQRHLMLVYRIRFDIFVQQTI